MKNTEQRKFLVAFLGEARVRQLESRGQLDESAKSLDDVLNVAYKGAPATFGEMDVERALTTFAVIIANIVLDASRTVDERVGLIERAVADLGDRLGDELRADKAVGAVLRAALDGALDELTEIATAGGRKATRADDAERATKALAGRVRLVLGPDGKERVAGLYAMQIGQGGKSRRHHPVAALWGALGLTGADVAATLNRAGSKGLGATRQRLYQLLDGPPADRKRVLAAIETAAAERGISTQRVRTATRAIAPDLVAGAKSTGREGHPADGYLRDLGL